MNLSVREPFSQAKSMAGACSSKLYRLLTVYNIMTHEIKRTYRYRVYPNEAQKKELACTFGCSRWVYNWGLETKTKTYHQNEESLSAADLSGRLTSKKKEEETRWLSEVSAVTLQQSLRNLSQAFTNFFEGRAEYPSFKSKKGDQTARYVGTAFDIRSGENGKRKLRLSKMPGLIRVRWSEASVRAKQLYRHEKRCRTVSRLFCLH